MIHGKNIHRKTNSYYIRIYKGNCLELFWSLFCTIMFELTVSLNL